MRRRLRLEPLERRLVLAAPVAADDAYVSIEDRTLFSSYSRSILGDDPVGYWRLDDATAATATDTAGGHHGTYVGFDTVDLNKSGAPLTDDDTSVQFDGMDNVVVVPHYDGVLELTGDLSIELWVFKDREGPDWYRLVGKGNTENRNVGVWEEPGDGGRILFQQGDGDGSVIELFSASSLSVGRWYHIVVTVAGDSVNLYIDGRLDASGTRTGTPVIDPDPLTFGYTSSGQHNGFFSGLLDEIAIYDYPLSDEQIALRPFETFSVLDNDSDPDGDTIVAGLSSGPSHGSVEFRDDGTFDYVPQADFYGTDSFSYTAFDGDRHSAPSIVTIIVNSVNDRPMAIDDHYSMNEDEALNVEAGEGVLTNDSDVDSATFSAVLTENVAHGNLRLSSDGSFSYTPNADFFGTDSFSYRASDGEDDSELATVTITINPVSDAPVVAADEYVVNEDQALNSSSYSQSILNDNPIGYWRLDDAVPTTAVDLIGGHDGVYQGFALNDMQRPGAPMVGDDTSVHFDGVNNVVVVPDDDDVFDLTGNFSVEFWMYKDSEAQRYQRLVGKGDDSTRTFGIWEEEGNAARILVQQYDGNKGVVIDLFSTSSVAIGRWYHIAATVAGDNVNLYIDGRLDARGTRSGTPGADESPLTFGADDHHTYFPGRLDEIAIYDYALGAEQIAQRHTSSVLDNDFDADGDSMTAHLASPPAHGILELHGDGTFQYTPDPEYSGIDSFSYTAFDGSRHSDPATVTITVNSVNDAPVASDDDYSLDEDDSLVIGVTDGVLANDSDVDSFGLTVDLEEDVSHGSLNLSSDGSFSYVPDGDYFGTDSFSYVARDAQQQHSPPATVTITVTNVDDGPASVHDQYTVLEDTLLVVDNSEEDPPPVPPPGAVSWRTEDGGNGNHYLIVRPPGGVTWAEARSGAEQLGGHLVTITSAAESNFLAANLPIGGGWIGGIQDRSSPSYAEPTGGWSWITGEPWSYTHWQSGEPNNSNGVEDYLQVDLNSGERWNDISEAGRDSYIAEFETGEVVVTVPLVSRGSIWSYLDDGSDQGTFWRSPGFDDSGWRQGRAQLGYGDNDEITVVGYGPSSANKFATTYFRHQFLVDDVTAVDELSVQLMRDDGAAVYVNGVEVFRDGNLPSAAPFDAYTSYEGSDNAEVPFPIDPGLLVDGENTVAVEVHQFRPTSSDVSFDLSLVATILFPPAIPGVLANDRDVDGDELYTELIGGPDNGDLTFRQDGSFTYLPHSDFFGTDSFTYRVGDESGLTDTASVTITVHPVNDAPSAVDDSYLLVDNEAIAIDAESGVLVNDSDAEGSPLSARIVEQPQFGTLTLDPDGSFQYSPGETFIRRDSFAYVAGDGELDSGVAVVSIVADIPTIDVGHHRVLPDAPNQIVELFVSGSHEVTGLNLRAQLGDGTGPMTEPIFQSVDFTGGIWEQSPTTSGGGPVAGAEQFVQANVQFSMVGVTATADGRIVRLVIDTTGITEGTFDLLLAGSEIGADTDFVGSLAHITNGQITITNSTVVGRHVFYNGSSFDGDDAVNAADDLAIATDKTALLPGETATFANYTSFFSGITGIMVDVAGLTGTPTAEDFRFSVGNDNDPDNWPAAPAPSGVVVRPGAGVDGADRVVIVWPEFSIRKQWLRVTVLAAGDTGLKSPDVFYFGNAVGDAGDSPSVVFVDGTDFALARDNPRNFLDPAPVDFPYDYNRDGFVDGFDLAVARDNGTNFLTALKLITVPEADGGGSPGLAAIFADAAVVAMDRANQDVATEEADPRFEPDEPLVWSWTRRIERSHEERTAGDPESASAGETSLEQLIELLATPTRSPVAARPAWTGRS